MIKVLGIGLQKTGTKSLRAALQRLGYPKERMATYDPVDCQLFLEGHRGRLVEKLARFDAAEDWPWPLLYRELYEAYPDALFVLTRRVNPEVWLDSLSAHAAWRRTGSPHKSMRAAIFGYEDPGENPAHHIEFYRRHNAEARSFFASKRSARFLEACWEEGAGWSELCAALSLPVPRDAFPHVNTRQARL